MPKFTMSKSLRTHLARYVFFFTPSVRFGAFTHIVVVVGKRQAPLGDE